jgi:signal transduction histidine kinase
MRNLVSNAIKYTHEGWVAQRCLHEPPSLVCFEVLDTGIGIPGEQLDHIYDEFYHWAARTRERARDTTRSEHRATARYAA